MSKRCPSCGFSNEDSRIYCSSCGELLDAQLRLLKDLNEQTSGERKPTYKEPPARHDPTSRAFRSTFDEDDVPRRRVQKKKSSPLPWIILALLVAGLIWLVASYAV